jgi:predicted Zn-dependent protease
MVSPGRYRMPTRAERVSSNGFDDPAHLTKEVGTIEYRTGAERPMIILANEGAVRKMLICFAAAFIALYVASCAMNPVTGRSQLMLVSENEEIQMGRELYPNAMWGSEGGGGEYKDEKLKAYLKSIILDIHRVSHRPNLPVDFAIQNSSIPNAWAIPGHVVITRGLLAGLDNEGEFVFVMGHEMGHVSARHSASQMSMGMLQKVVLGGAGIALGGSDYSDAALTAGALGGGLLLLKYSRDDELEADRLGVQYMSVLSYDPRNAVSAHRNLEKVSNEYLKSLGQNSQERGLFQNLLSTHPRTSVRIEEIQYLISKVPRAPLRGDGSNRQQFQSMIAGIKNANRQYVNYDKAVSALNNNKPDEALNFVTKAINADQTQAPFFALAGFITLKKRNLPEAEKNFGSALRLDGNYQPALRGMGALRYMKESYAESIQYLEKGLTLFPEDLSSHYFLGMSYYKTRAYGTAINHLKPFADAQPKHPTIHYVLASCYENINDPNSAYKEYNLQLQVAPDNDTGKRAAERARVLKGNLK